MWHYDSPKLRKNVRCVVGLSMHTDSTTAPPAVQRWMVMGMNKLFELFEAERPNIPDSNADYYIGYNNGLCMAQAIVLKRDVVEVVRCKDCKHWCYEYDDVGLCVTDVPDIDGVQRLADDFCSYGERRTE